MIIKKLFALILCLLTGISSIMTVNAEEEHTFHIYITDLKTGEYNEYVIFNRVVNEIEGMSWDKETGTLTLDNFSQPAWEISTDTPSESRPYININVVGNNELCKLKVNGRARISGEGTLNVGFIQARDLETNLRELNLNSEYQENDPDPRGFIGVAIISTASKPARFAFLGGKINIQGNYDIGILGDSADIEISDTDIIIDIPETGHVGISCGDMNVDGTEVGGKLKIKNSSIYIRIRNDYGGLITCHYLEDVNHNLKYYTGHDHIQRRLTYEEAFIADWDRGFQELTRLLYSFPNQNCFMITNKFLFDDVVDSSKYYYEPVYWAFNHKPVQITTGTSNTQFSPDKNVTRGQMVTFLYRLAGEPEVQNAKTFDDVEASKYYAKAISWAASEGITTGYYGTNNFGPDDNCTREQIVTFLWRYAKTPAPVKSASFTDAKEGAYYLDALSWAAENGITVGLNDGTGRFGVGHTCTRGMCVTFLYRYASLGQK